MPAVKLKQYLSGGLPTHYCKMKNTPSVLPFLCLNSCFSSMVCPINLKLYVGIENYHRQRLTKTFVSFTHCPCPFCINYFINNDQLLPLPVDLMSENMDSKTLPMRPILWSKVELHPHCSLLWEALCSAGLHVTELCNPTMTRQEETTSLFSGSREQPWSLLSFFIPLSPDHKIIILLLLIMAHFSVTLV